MSYTESEDPQEVETPRPEPTAEESQSSDDPFEHRLPRFLQFLAKVAEAVAERAVEEEAGQVRHEVLKLRERTEQSNGLSCIRIIHTNDEGEETSFRMFAAGAYRDKNMIKLEREDEDEYVIVSSSPHLVLAYISF